MSALVKLLSFLMLAGVILWMRHQKQALPQPGPVNAEAAARRALALGTLVRRGMQEALLAPVDDAAQRAEAVRVQEQTAAVQRKWLEDTGLMAHLTPGERTLLDRPFGTWTEEERAHASWRHEALAALAWALGRRAGLTPFHQPLEQVDVTEELGVGGDPAALVTDAELLDEHALADAAEQARLWHWRAAMAAEKPGKRLKSVREAAEHASRCGWAGMVDGDFDVDGTPFRDLPPETVDVVANVAAERLTAVEWLLGHARWEPSA